MKQLTFGAIVAELNRQTKPFLLVLVGLPGSGKSTFVNKLKENFSLHVASTDDLIERDAAKAGKTYSEYFKIANQKNLKREMDEGITTAVYAGKNIVNDQTNMGGKKRKALLDSINDDYAKYAIVFDVDSAVLKERLEKRAAATGKVIPDHVIHNMTSNYQAPSTREGFTDVWVLKGNVV